MKVTVYLPDQFAADVADPALNVSRLLRDALIERRRERPTPEELVQHARLVVKQARAMRQEGPVHDLLAALADEVAAARESHSQKEPT